MKDNIRISNNAEECAIDIEGTIGVPEAWQFDDPAQRVATYDAFRDAVRRIGDLEATHIVVNIRSTGGDVNDALLIYEALAALPARITTRCYGYTASAATIIAQAASEGCRELSANTLYLIHNAVCATEGNADELTARLELLRQTDQRLAALYASRSGRTAEEFALLMSANNGCGRWLSPDEVVTAGLADQVIGVEMPHQKPTLTQNIARGWRRLVARTSAPATPAPSEDRNILHFDDDTQLHTVRSVIAAQEAQQHVQPTATQPCEDPATHEMLQSANQNAYSSDAKRFSKF
ncbi:MAG: Clp protease ClpP [Alistipes sp.]